MAITKGYELGQLANDLTVDSAGSITIDNTIIVDYEGFDSDFNSKSTANLSEGSNLYYTPSRFDNAFASKSTTSLSEGSNLYYTNARADARIAAADTDDLSEGSSNLYYTNARADARAQLKIDALVGSAPGTLDTLQELGDALGDDANFSTTITNSIATKLPLAGGTMTGALTVSSRVGVNQSPAANNYTLQVTGLETDGTDGRAVLVKGSSASTTIGGAGPSLALQNTNNTVNNVTKLSFETASAGEAVSLNAINTNHSSFYGDLAINTRGSGGYSEKMRVTADGKVGIGTTSPNSNLHIKSTGDVKLTLETDEDNDCWINLSGATSEASIGYEPASNSLRFANAADGVTSNVRMTIDASGNVGIGTDTPQKPLEVISPQNGYASIGRQMSVGSYSGIHFGYLEPGNTSYRKSAIVFERTDLTSNDAQGKIHILNGPQGNSGSADLTDAKLTIAENGNVGIGTSSPSVNLDVEGIIQAHMYVRKNAGEEPLEIQANGSLGKWVAFENNTVKVAACYFGTKIFEEDPMTGTVTYIGDFDPNSNGTFTPTAGRIYYTNGKPVNMISMGNHDTIAPFSAAGRYFGFGSTRYQPQRIRAFAVGGNVTINIYLDGGITSRTGGTIDYTFEVEANHQNYIDISLDSGTFIIEVVGGTAILTRSGQGGGDMDVLRPASRLLYVPDSSFGFSHTRSIFSYTDATSSGSKVVYLPDFSEPVIASKIGDGAGGDTQTGMPLLMLGNNYLIPHNLNGYTVESPYPNCDVRVSYYNGSTWVTHDTHSLNGSFTGPDAVAEGELDTYGAGEVNSGDKCIWVSANAPFTMKVNDQSDGDEYEPIGWLTEYHNIATQRNTLLIYNSAGSVVNAV